MYAVFVNMYVFYIYFFLSCVSLLSLMMLLLFKVVSVQTCGNQFKATAHALNFDPELLLQWAAVPSMSCSKALQQDRHTSAHRNTHSCHFSWGGRSLPLILKVSALKSIILFCKAAFLPPWLLALLHHRLTAFIACFVKHESKWKCSDISPR